MKKVNLQITTLTGSIVKQQPLNTLNSFYNLSTSELTSGIYILKLVNGTTESNKFKLIVIH
jgi:Secretion system C-terminal sorting domain